MIQVCDRHGRVVASSSSLHGSTLPLATDVPRERLETVTLGRGAPLRILTVPLRDSDDRAAGWIVVAESLRLLEATRHSARNMALYGLAALSAGIIVTLIVLSRGLSPLSAVARAADDIVETGDVSRRIVRPSGQDEVTRVATAFNAVVQRVEELLETQKHLLADTSHELRNPLTVIRTDLDLLGRDLDPAMRLEVAAEAGAEAARMARLVDDLLLLSLLDARPRLPREALHLDVLAREVVDRMRPEKGPAVEVDAASPVPVMGCADRLRQVVENLLANAIRHTEAHRHVRVRAWSTKKEACLSVEDEGVGIPAEHLSRIFDRFYRVDVARSRSSGGTGLGLSIARALVDAHGGTLRAESTVGRGTRFTMCLPRSDIDPLLLASLQETLNEGR